MKIPGEFEIIDKIRHVFLPSDRNVTGIGDDSAVIWKTGQEKMLITTDSLVEEVHFLKDRTDFFDLGYKSIAVNMSDIAAMGGVPAYALLTLGVNGNMAENDLDSFINGVKSIRDKQPFELIGGDVVRSPCLFTSVTMIGYTGTEPFLRSSALPGDYIYITGYIGDSSLGLSLLKGGIKQPVLDEDYFINRHFRPDIRVGLMQYLKKRYEINAAIDVSDGLLSDLSHIADESGMGFRIEVERLPLSVNKIGPSFDNDRNYFYDFALSGGEDYEVLFTSQDIIDAGNVFSYTGTKITNIGRIEKNSREVSFMGTKLEWEGLKKGYTHF